MMLLQILLLVGILNDVNAYNSPQYTHNLARENYKLVPYFAQPLIKKYKLSTFHREELMQEGYIGLIYACRKYDDTKNVAISTYSSYWIKSYMGKYIKKMYKTPRSLELHQNRYVVYDYEATIDLDVLDPLEQEFVRKRYFQRMKMKHLAKHYGISRNSMTRYSKKILDKLKWNIEHSE